MTDASREASYHEFVGLLSRSDRIIRRFVSTLLPHGDAVDDVVQETALECWRRFDGFVPTDPDDAAADFGRWACVIARYKAMSWQRDHSRDRLVFREEVMEKIADSGLQYLSRIDDEQRAIEHCLQKLEPDQRRLVLSVHSPGESIAKIASETGENARRLYRQVNTLRQGLFHCVQGRLATETSHG
ncbi:MAG: sigma-70 family RNA polymerase sigma factor [Planctomycetota bacterium]